MDKKVITKETLRNNNFDLIRLFAAIQVLLLHANHHLKISNKYFNEFLDILRPFPGVPIFFILSGYLIYNSYLRNKNDLNIYIRNRVLRVFPLLIVSTFLLLIALVMFSDQILINDLIKWFIGQISFFQFYTPDSLRSFGVGNPNGALWTIPVELGFYFLVPFIYIAISKFNYKALIILFLISPLIKIGLNTISDESFIYKVVEVSTIYYLSLFLIGISFAIYFDHLYKYFANNFYLWLLIYFVFYFALKIKLGLYSDLYSPNFIGYIAVIILAFLVMSFAFSFPGLSNRLLKGNDISYGVYVIHMPIINIYLELNYFGSFWTIITAAMVIITLAFFSWKFLEKPFLSLKFKTN
jgi:peptidoglycan/LPS O-acetylase OafA/YrhL